MVPTIAFCTHPGAPHKVPLKKLLALSACSMSRIYLPVSTTTADLQVNGNLAQEILDASIQKYNGNLPAGCIASRIEEARNTKRFEIKLPIESVRELQSLDMFLNNGIQPKKGLMVRTFGQSYGMKVGHV